MKTLLNKQQLKSIGTRLAGTLAIPVGVIAILFIACAAGGKNMFPYEVSFTNFIRGILTLMLTTIALSINLGSGRFDFSLGSMALLSSVIGAQIVMQTGGGAWVMLIFCVLSGAVLGAISGGLYVLLKLPPIITSLGVTLLYEGIAFAITGGSNMRLLGTNTDSITNSVGIMIAFIIIFLAIIYFVFDNTKFGYNYKALKEGQKVSVNTGIKEIPNAIVCYTITGLLMSVVGFLNNTFTGTIQVSGLNFGSIGIMFGAFLPMFIGGFIGRFSNDKLGYFLAAVTMTLFSMMYSAFSLTNSVQAIISAVLLVAFLIYLSNEKLIKELVTFKHLREYLKRRKSAVGAEG